MVSGGRQVFCKARHAEGTQALAGQRGARHHPLGALSFSSSLALAANIHVHILGARSAFSMLASAFAFGQSVHF